VTKTDFSDDTRGVVRRRAGDRCELCKSKPIRAFHHRKLRRHGDNSVENCLGLCTECHTVIHSNGSDYAYRHGLLLKSWDDPATVGAWTDCLSACYLNHVG
jgi:hypothetical protein